MLKDKSSEAATSAPKIIKMTEIKTPQEGFFSNKPHWPMRIIIMEILLSAENIATLTVAEPDNPKKIFKIFNTQIFKILRPGF